MNTLNHYDIYHSNKEFTDHLFSADHILETKYILSKNTNPEKANSYYNRMSEVSPTHENIDLFAKRVPELIHEANKILKSPALFKDKSLFLSAFEKLNLAKFTLNHYTDTFSKRSFSNPMLIELEMSMDHVKDENGQEIKVCSLIKNFYDENTKNISLSLEKLNEKIALYQSLYNIKKGDKFLKKGLLHNSFDSYTLAKSYAHIASAYSSDSHGIMCHQPSWKKLFNIAHQKTCKLQKLNQNIDFKTTLTKHDCMIQSVERKSFAHWTEKKLTAIPHISGVAHMPSKLDHKLFHNMPEHISRTTKKNILKLIS